MRILMTTTRGAGHFGPLVPFARAVESRGHSVLVAVPAASTDMVQRAGLAAWPTADAPGEELDAAFAGVMDLSHDESNERVLRDVFAGVHARAALPGILSAARWFRPHVIVRESAEFAGAVAADLVGVPHVRVSVGQSSFERLFLPMAAPAIDRLRAGVQLPADPGATGIAGETVLTRTPVSFDGPGAGQAHRFCDTTTEPAPLPDWWTGSEAPLLYVTFGSVAAGHGFWPDVYRGALDALAALPVRVLVTTGRAADPGELGPLPANAHVERWVPQDDVLAHAAAMVGHGGFGTTLGGLTAGVPQAVLPLFADQPYNAARIAEMGAGIALEGGPAAVERVGAAVEQLLDDPGYALAALRVAVEVRALPPVDAAVDVLEGITRRGA